MAYQETTTAKMTGQEVAVGLNHEKEHRRKISLTQAEEFFLRALLLEPTAQAVQQKQRQQEPFDVERKLVAPSFHPDDAKRSLSEQDLFTVPEGTVFVQKKGRRRHDRTSMSSETVDTLLSPPLSSASITSSLSVWQPPVPAPTSLVAAESSGSRFGRPCNRPSISGLWKAHQWNISSRELVKRGSLRLLPRPSAFANNVKLELECSSNEAKVCSTGDDDEEETEEELDQKLRQLVANLEGGAGLGSKMSLREDENEDELEDDAASDEEIRRESKQDIGDEDEEANLSQVSSWSDDDHMEHFDAWEVLKDEYAKDFGFDFTPKALSAAKIFAGDSLPNNFRILGTSADDPSVQPHVLSPPLMDTLMNSLPEQLRGENYWLRFSLARDGSSLETLKSYVRGSKYTLIAVETPGGEVFGSFTSSPWHNSLGFFGSSPAFVWKMRHSRRKRVASLYDQAQLESVVDVYKMKPGSGMVQVCRHDGIAVGGDEALPSVYEFDDVHTAASSSNSGGFAFTLDQDLFQGITNPSLTFGSPSLCGPNGNKSHVFEIAGVEVWTFTPCIDVASAEKLEMTKFFVEGSLRSSSSNSSSFRHASSMSWGSGSNFSSRDFDVKKFYERVGSDAESNERRQRWSQTEMKYDSAGSVGKSPGFL